MALPQVGKFDQSVTVQWSNGSNFDGFILVGLVPPTNVTDWAEIGISGYYPPQRVPVFARVPIVDGKFDSTAGLFFNADLEPPNTRYVAWYYDITRRQIAGPSSQFQVTADPFTPPSLTLTAPSAGSTNPTPDT